MTLVISTSTSLTSVALYEGSKLLWGEEKEAPRAASQAAIEMFEKLKEDLPGRFEQIEVFAADCGPGSFTGVKVGVTLAKVLAFASGKAAAGISAFDLADPATTALPARKGWIYVRGSSDAEPENGRAWKGKVSALLAGPFVDGLVTVPPEDLNPEYGAEPMVSKAKNPTIMGGPS